MKTLLDAGGPELEAGIEGRPTVVTPNQHEAEHLLGRTLLTRTHYLEAAEKIGKMGPESVLLSAGSRGAVGAFRDGLVEVVPPRIDAVCPIGAGDALAAGYVWATERKVEAGGRTAMGRRGGNRLGAPSREFRLQPSSRPGRYTARWKSGASD